jgi:hypothetical protein
MPEGLNGCLCRTANRCENDYSGMGHVKECEYWARDLRLRWELWLMCHAVVNLAELKRACKRLLSRMSDECASGNEWVIFIAEHDTSCIQIPDACEIISVTVLPRGRESVPYALMWNMAQTLRFRKNKVEDVVSENDSPVSSQVKVEPTVLRRAFAAAKDRNILMLLWYPETPSPDHAIAGYAFVV